MKRISLPRRAVSCAIAASLALTLNPISAFAEGNVAADSTELNISPQSQQSEPMLFANESNLNAPFALLTNNPSAGVINVTAPLKLFFDGQNGTLDIATDKLAKAQGSIKNNGDYYDVMLESIKVHNEGLEQVLDTQASEKNILTEQIFSIRDASKEDTDENKIKFAANKLDANNNLVDNEIRPSDKETFFVVPNNSTGTCEFQMNVDGLKKASASKEDNGLDSHALISVTCVFDATALGIPAYERSHPNATADELEGYKNSARAQDFFFQVTDQNHVDYGRVYNISEVKQHANKISEDPNANVTKSYENFAKNKGGYICALRYKSGITGERVGYTPLTVVGVRQDVTSLNPLTYAGISFLAKNNTDIITRADVNGWLGHEYWYTSLNNPNSGLLHTTGLFESLANPSGGSYIAPVIKATVTDNASNFASYPSNFTVVDNYFATSVEQLWMPSVTEVSGDKIRDYHENIKDLPVYNGLQTIYPYETVGYDRADGLWDGTSFSKSYQYFQDMSYSNAIAPAIPYEELVHGGSWWLRSFVGFHVHFVVLSKTEQGVL